MRPTFYRIPRKGPDLRLKDGYPRNPAPHASEALPAVIKIQNAVTELQVLLTHSVLET